MKPHIQYTKSADGISIALWTQGKGKPLVYMTGGPWNHIELWQLPECQQWYERITHNRMLVRYDMRGTGLSEHHIKDHSMQAQMQDLEAVVSHLGLEQFDLFAAMGSGPVALAYAAQNPERVTHLILWCSWAKSYDARSSRIQAWRSLLSQDWELMTDTCAQIVLGWSGGEVGRLAAEQLRKSVTPEETEATLTAMGQFDATTFLPEVKSPALILHRTGISWIPVTAAQHLASQIQNAHLVLIEGESPAPYLGNIEEASGIIIDFLGKIDKTPDPSGSRENTDGLTGREMEILGLIANGKTNKEIAGELYLSVRTIERHIGNIYAKINARGRADATAYALTHNMN